MKDKVRYLFTDKKNTLKRLFFGSSAVPLSIFASSPILRLYTTTAVTTGTVRSFQLEQTHTGIGAVAEGLVSIVKTNVALGGWANAIFAKLDFQTVGKVTGMGGVICAELTMAGGAVSQGTYATFQAEINLPASYSSGVPISVMRINTWGDQKADFDTYGYLFDIAGVTDGSFFHSDVPGTLAASLRLRVGSTPYYIGLYSALDD